MKFHFSHLKVKASTPDETGRLLSEHVQEVEHVETRGVIARGVVTGKIVDVQKHPNADKLRIVTLDLGGEMLDIVTGAPNVALGHIIPVAKVGAHVRMVNHHASENTVTSNELVEIKAVNLRGITSPGMVCGADELGISDDVVMGVHIFAEGTKLGVPVESVIASSAVIETDDKGTAHRPDLLSYRGVEAELAAVLNTPFKRSFPDLPEKTGELNVTIEAAEACDLFLAARIDSFSTFESPQWLKDFLTEHEIKVINLPTDVTNYVMLTEGGATHAFGAEHIANNSLTVRFARIDESIETLNNRSYTLGTEDLVIADSEKALDIAGIIGGKQTSVNEQTKSIVLTSIVIDASTVRRTAKRLNIRTDASARRERGQGVAVSVQAFTTILALLQEIAHVKIRAFNFAGSIEAKQAPIEIDIAHLDKFLHVSLNESEVMDLLRRLNYSVTGSSVTPPWWRADVHSAADVYEDVARLYGYNRIQSHLPHFEHQQESPITRVTALLRQQACQDMYEVETSSTQSMKSVGSIEIQNPIGDKKYVRQTPLPELFKLAERYTRDGFEGYRCFEIGKSYRQNGTELEEKLRFSAVIAGDPEAAKSYCAHLLHRLHIPLHTVHFTPCNQSEDRAIKYDAVAKIHAGDTLIGHLCVKTSRGTTYSGLKLYVDALATIAELHPKYAVYSKFPTVKRDIAFVARREHELGSIVREIKKQSELLQSVVLFDQFSDKNGDTHEQSLAFHLQFQSEDRTLTDTEVGEIMKKIETALINKIQVKMRA